MLNGFVFKFDHSKNEFAKAIGTDNDTLDKTINDVADIYIQQKTVGEVIDILYDKLNTDDAKVLCSFLLGTIHANTIIHKDLKNNPANIFGILEVASLITFEDEAETFLKKTVGMQMTEVVRGLKKHLTPPHTMSEVIEYIYNIDYDIRTKMWVGYVAGTTVEIIRFVNNDIKMVPIVIG